MKFAYGRVLLSKMFSVGLDASCPSVPGEFTAKDSMLEFQCEKMMQFTTASQDSVWYLELREPETI